MHQAGHTNNRCRNLAGDGIIGDVKNGNPLEISDIGRNFAGQLVSDKVQDSERGERGETLGYLARYSFPVSDYKVGETVELANFGRNRTGHVPGTTRFYENRVFRFAAEVYIGDSFCCWVTVNAVPFGRATVVASPGFEDAQVRLGQGGFEG